MNKSQTLQDFLVNQSAEISVYGFLVNLALATLFSFILAQLYIRFGNALSNRRIFSKNLIFITMTTMLVITIVKSSLALSLGLVGALSIVRFRTAIKEPEELAYLFLAIAIGLGFGANQGLITIIAIAVTTVVIMILNKSHKEEQSRNIHLTVLCDAPPKMELSQLIDILKAHCSKVVLKRFDEEKNKMSSTFMVEFTSPQNMESTKKEIQNLNDSAKIIYLDSRGDV